MAHVLLVDDDRGLRDLLSSYLAENGITVMLAKDGQEALGALRDQDFDAVILDIMMPGLDGIEVLRRIRQMNPERKGGNASTTIPVLMLTARGDETDRVVGLELGADDYIAKPFSPRELLARLRAVLRRARAAPSSHADQIREGDLALQIDARTVTLADRVIEVTGLEFDILLLLLRRAGRVVTREALIQETARGAINDRAIDVHVSHLRQKIGADRIRTVRGVGYVFSKVST
jgi:DNA-binding response OmpR family regulator